MKVYFVRHGESELNASGSHQFPHTPLSTQGLKQAEYVAKRFVSLPIEKIITSDYERALQTAEIISSRNAFPLEVNPLLREKKWPSEVAGLMKEDAEGNRIKKLLLQNAHDKDWHFSDEENVHDIFTRAQNFIDVLSTLKNNHILIVSHGTFIRTIILKMMFKDNINPDIFYTFRKFMTLNNTGLTVVSYENTLWKLITWNDYAHLGE